MSTFTRYEQLLVFLRDQGYEFIDFRRIVARESDLPEMTVVVRYDIHHRDIDNAYAMMDVEQRVFGRQIATAFVMWDLKGDTEYELNWEKDRMADYERFVFHCLENDKDVQPHISPINSYLYRHAPDWRSCTVEELNELFRENYRQISFDDGCEIEVVKEDPLEISRFNECVIEILIDYNEAWTSRFGIDVQGYSSHGNHVALNRVLNNGIVLDQREVLSSGLYEYEVYGSRIRKRLDFHADGSIPLWIFEPERITSNRLQLLCHPDLWANDRLDKEKEKFDAKRRSRGYASYPYLAPIDVVRDLTDFLESREDINDYNSRKRNCCF